MLNVLLVATTLWSAVTGSSRFAAVVSSQYTVVGSSRFAAVVSSQYSVVGIPEGMSPEELITIHHLPFTIQKSQVESREGSSTIHHSPFTISSLYSPISTLLKCDIMNRPLQILQQLLRPFWSSIRDEDLAEVFFSHHLDQTLDAAVVKFVEDVVEEQEWFAGLGGDEGVELR